MSYYVNASNGSVKDMAGNNYVGTVSYNFTTLAGGSLVGTAGNDFLQSTEGSDVINGLAGVDSAVYTGALANYSITKLGASYMVSGLGATDSLLNVERITFSDKTINLTIQSLAASTPSASLVRLEELYVAFFNRVPDADGLSFWMQQLNGGMSLNSIADAFYSAGVQYPSLTGLNVTMTSGEFVNVIYRNVLGRTSGADPEALAFWSEELQSGRASKGSLVTTILDSAHTFKNDPTWGWVANLLDNKIIVADRFAVDLGLNYNSSQDSISHGMAIAAAVTPYDTSAALSLIGVTQITI